MAEHAQDTLDLFEALGSGASVDCAIRCAIRMQKNGSSECSAKILTRYAEHHGYKLDALADHLKKAL